jgi:hypothetical protein
LLGCFDLLDLDAALARLDFAALDLADERLADADRPAELDLRRDADLLAPPDRAELPDRLALDFPRLPDPVLDADLPPERVVFVPFFAM